MKTTMKGDVDGRNAEVEIQNAHRNAHKAATAADDVLVGIRAACDSQEHSLRALVRAMLDPEHFEVPHSALMALEDARRALANARGAIQQARQALADVTVVYRVEAAKETT